MKPVGLSKLMVTELKATQVLCEESFTKLCEQAIVEHTVLTTSLLFILSFLHKKKKHTNKQQQQNKQKEK